jgi:hypothetical protein
VNKSIERAWGKALSSGRYFQQRGGQLRLNDRFDVLGVLCELHRTATGIGKWDEFDDSYLDAHFFLPDEVKEWARLNSEPRIKGAYLSDLNDWGLGFTKLAELIARHGVSA